MLAALMTVIPEQLKEILTRINDASPAVLIVIGALLFLFAGVAKWVIKTIGAGLVIYGLITLFHLL